MLEITMLAIWLVLRTAPDTSIGRALHRWMVENPARGLDRLSRGHVLLALLLIAVVGAVIWVMENEGVVIMSMAAPEAAAFLTSFEISAYLDVIAALAVTASTVRIRAVGSRLRGRVGAMVRATPRSARARQAPRPIRPDAANDDGDGRGRIPIAA